MDKLFGQFAMLLGEARVGGREMPGGYEIEQAVNPGLKVRLAGLELPQLLAPRLDRLGGETEPPREGIAQPLGNEEARPEHIKDDELGRASCRDSGCPDVLLSGVPE